MSIENPIENKSLVSVICRTLGRDQLQLALQSVALQTYPNIEIVLVDAAGSNSLNYESAAARIPVNLVSTNQPLSRSQAANAGLEAAKGKYIQFLDDDDWIDPAHLSQLVDFLDKNEKFQAAYSSTQKTTSAGNPVDYVFREDYDPILLMRDNYIPIHAMLFESSLLQQGCRFDEAFDIYEDWDFWLQLSQHTAFHHIESLTAFYREGGDSDTAVEDVRLRYKHDNIPGKGRAALFDKWLLKWSGERVNSLIGQLDQSVLLCELDVEIHSQSVLLCERDAEIHSQSVLLCERDAEIHNQSVVLCERDAEIHNQSVVLCERDAEIHNQSVVLCERDAEIHNQSVVLCERDAEIHSQLWKNAELQHQLAQQNIQITELTQRNSDRDLNIAQMQRHDEDRVRHIGKLEMTLDTIYKSRIWKLMGPVRRVARVLTSNATNNTDTSSPDNK